MPSRIRNVLGFVPGGYPYTEPRHKGQPEQLFKAESYSLREQAAIVLRFRISNGRPRATLAQTMEDIDVFTCQRLGGHERWCFDTEKGYTEIHKQLNRKGCGSCGGHKHG